MQNAECKTQKSQGIFLVWLPPLGGREMPALIFRLKPEATHAIDGGAS
jgi:hypothetical protein